MGVGPLPFESKERLHAPGIRTWQIATALANRRHFITLCVIEFGDFQGTGNAGKPAAVRQDVGQNINMVRLAYHPEETAAAIRTLHTATRFSSVVSTTDIMCGIASDLELDIPLWLDYNGDPFAEKQLQARLYSHDGSLLPQWGLYLKGLLSGDKLSVCSNPQRHAMIGQLAFAGRLTGINSGEELVQVLPNCSRVMSERTPRRVMTIKGNRIPTTAFLVLWTGGYNTWCDPETLFRGLESAMKANPAIFFATTGGALEGHDNRSFQHFFDLVQQSPMRDRFLFLGWVPTEEVSAYFEQADLAIFVDRYSVEGELGTRTRIVDWVSCNVPIACTNLCELTHEMAAESLISTFHIGDHASLASVILNHAASPEDGRVRAEAAREWFDANYDEATMLAPLLDWAEAAKFARDRANVITNAKLISGSWFSEVARIQLDAIPAEAAAGEKKAAKLKGAQQPKTSLKEKLTCFFIRKS
jgi:glycosyltransferase involved in cell wall biosynthesis